MKFIYLRVLLIITFTVNLLAQEDSDYEKGYNKV